VAACCSLVALCQHSNKAIIIISSIIIIIYFAVQAERELGAEEASDRQLRAQFGPMWDRTPSEVLSGPIRHELARYRSIITNAMSSDGMVRQRFNSHSKAIAMLSQSDVRNACLRLCVNLVVQC